jgi:hypothetical protein
MEIKTPHQIAVENQQAADRNKVHRDTASKDIAAKVAEGLGPVIQKALDASLPTALEGGLEVVPAPVVIPVSPAPLEVAEVTPAVTRLTETPLFERGPSSVPMGEIPMVAQASNDLKITPGKALKGTPAKSLKSQPASKIVKPKGKGK